MLIIAAALAAAPGPTATWIGQDGHDRANGSPALGASDVQDIHIALDGLRPGRKVVHVRVAGLGDDVWEYQGKWGPWAAALEQAPGSTRADLYFEPARLETGRPFQLKLTYDDGTVAEIALRGRRANPNLRMPGVALGATWIGQAPNDCVGAGPAVGPDGFQDARLALRGLSSVVEIKSIVVASAAGARWQFGTNPQGDSNAELVRDPKEPAKAELAFQPVGDLSGQRLKVTVAYANGKNDAATVIAGPTDPGRKMPAIAVPEPADLPITARWMGQDQAPGAAPGDVHVAVAGIPSGRSITAAALSDAVRGYWVYRRKPGDPALTAVGVEAPLAVRPGSDPTGADLFFAPIRDESQTMLTLRLVLSDGALAIVRFPGGPCDLALRVPETAGTSIDARPGDDLAVLVNRHRTVKLAAGTYRLSRPLILNEPVALLGAPGATLLFAQGADEPPWPAAITIHRSRTTLAGFAVRFAGPVRWKRDVPWGPAIIGATDTSDGSHPDPRIGLVLTRLDLEAPPAADPKGWEDAPLALRLVNSRGGRVAQNRIKGGYIDLSEGPWEVVDNEYCGTMPGTVSPCVVAAHYGYDLVVRGNRARPVGQSGKTWRFLVLTNSGSNDRIEENVVVGIGPRDDDTIPPSNASEVVLTEAYRLHFEGKPAAISGGGRIVSLGQGQPLGTPASTGAVVAVLAGAQPGQWRRITQALDAVTYLLDEPLPPGTDRIAVTTGFVNETFARNTIDSRGGSKAANLILAGNHFGTRVLDNHLLGAGDAFQITAYPTESPGIWGWSHAPFLGCLIAGNTLEDSEQGGTVGVLHSQATKSSRGRTYMTATLRDNTVKWTSGFLHRQRLAGARVPPPALTIGWKSALDPGELVVATRNNRLDAPAEARSAVAVRVHAAILNGEKTIDRGFALSPLGGTASPSAAGPAAGSRR
jgi:hypothetical protein